jgi:hypothetical protein
MGIGVGRRSACAACPAREHHKTQPGQVTRRARWPDARSHVTRAPPRRSRPPRAQGAQRAKIGRSVRGVGLRPGKRNSREALRGAAGAIFERSSSSSNLPLCEVWLRRGGRESSLCAAGCAATRHRRRRAGRGCRGSSEHATALGGPRVARTRASSSMRPELAVLHHTTHNACTRPAASP